MNKKDRYTTIFPYYDRKEYDYYYEVGKLKRVKYNAEIVILLDTIKRRAETFDAFQFNGNIHLQKDWNTIKETVLGSMNIGSHKAYCILEMNMDKFIMGTDSLYMYLKKRIEEEFFGDIFFSICWREKNVEKIALIYGNAPKVKQIRIEF